MTNFDDRGSKPVSAVFTTPIPASQPDGSDGGVPTKPAPPAPTEASSVNANDPQRVGATDDAFDVYEEEEEEILEPEATRVGGVGRDNGGGDRAAAEASHEMGPVLEAMSQDAIEGWLVPDGLATPLNGHSRLVSRAVPSLIAGRSLTLSLSPQGCLLPLSLFCLL